jgi:hypothetical protein
MLNIWSFANKNGGKTQIPERLKDLLPKDIGTIP